MYYWACSFKKKEINHVKLFTEDGWHIQMENRNRSPEWLRWPKKKKFGTESFFSVPHPWLYVEYTSEFHQTEEEAALDHDCISSKLCLKFHLQNSNFPNQYTWNKTEPYILGRMSFEKFLWTEQRDSPWGQSSRFGTLSSNPVKKGLFTAKVSAENLFKIRKLILLIKSRKV